MVYEQTRVFVQRYGDQIAVVAQQLYGDVLPQRICVCAENCARNVWLAMRARLYPALLNAVGLDHLGAAEDLVVSIIAMGLLYWWHSARFERRPPISETARRLETARKHYGVPS